MYIRGEIKIYKNKDLKDLENEIWKDIDGYDDYQVSNYGRIKSLKNRKVKILEQIKDNSGYLFVNLYKNGKCESKRIHRLLFETFIVKLKDDECIHHLDENKLNNYINNLQKMVKFEHKIFHNSEKNHPKGMLGKCHSEESKKLISKKLSGENNPNHILIKQDIILIRKYLNENNLSQKKIAEIFGVSQPTVSKIKNNKIRKI